MDASAQEKAKTLGFTPGHFKQIAVGKSTAADVEKGLDKRADRLAHLFKTLDLDADSIATFLSRTEAVGDKLIFLGLYARPIKDMAKEGFFSTKMIVCLLGGTEFKQLPLHFEDLKLRQPLFQNMQAHGFASEDLFFLLYPPAENLRQSLVRLESVQGSLTRLIRTQKYTVQDMMPVLQFSGDKLPRRVQALVQQSELFTLFAPNELVEKVGQITRKPWMSDLDQWAETIDTVYQKYKSALEEPKKQETPDSSVLATHCTREASPSKSAPKTGRQ